MHLDFRMLLYSEVYIRANTERLTVFTLKYKHSKHKHAMQFSNNTGKHVI